MQIHGFSGHTGICVGVCVEVLGRFMRQVYTFVLGLWLVYGWQLIVNVAAEGRLFRRP